MAGQRRPRYRVMFASGVALVLTSLVALTVTWWGWLGVPSALRCGAGAWKGLSLAESWHALPPGHDPGMGPAGLG